MPILKWNESSGAGSETGKQGGHSSQDDLLSLFDWTRSRPSLDLPICAVRASSQWPPLCVLLRRGSLPLVLYYASHLGPNLGPRIWGPWTRGPIAPSNSGPLRPLVLLKDLRPYLKTQKPVRSFTTLKTAIRWSPKRCDRPYKPSCAQCTTACVQIKANIAYNLRFSFLCQNDQCTLFIIGLLEVYRKIVRVQDLFRKHVLTASSRVLSLPKSFWHETCMY